MSILKFFLFLFFSSVLTHCEIPSPKLERYVPILSPKFRIIGGDEAAPHSFPFIAGLVINGNSFCAGTLISPNYVLTAAQCASLGEDVEVILGAHNITTSEATQVHIKADNTTIHPDYNETSLQNNIALLHLVSAPTLNSNIQVATLPARSDADSSYFAETVVAAGWGLSQDGSDPSQALREASLTILDVYTCSDYFGGTMEYVTESNLCTSGYRNVGTCKGDQGGPLVHDGTQIGVVSMGSDLCEMCLPSVYTNVGKFLDWIGDNSDVVIKN